MTQTASFLGDALPGQIIIEPALKFRHSGLDPESSSGAEYLDSGSRALWVAAGMAGTFNFFLPHQYPSAFAIFASLR